jgi:hypothetical protein
VSELLRLCFSRGQCGRFFHRRVRSRGGWTHPSRLPSSSIPWRPQVDGAIGAIVIFDILLFFARLAGQSLPRHHACQRSARPPLGDGRCKRRATTELAPSCAQRAQARGEDGVLSLLSNPPDTSTKLLVSGPTRHRLCRRHMPFLRRRASEEHTGDIVTRSSTAPRALISVERTARLASTNVTSPQSVAHVLLRYCAIAKLIASGSPYFVHTTLNSDTH